MVACAVLAFGAGVVAFVRFGRGSKVRLNAPRDASASCVIDCFSVTLSFQRDTCETHFAIVATLVAIAIGFGDLAASASPTPFHADVLIGAGHEGRPASCKRFPTHKCNMGTAGEKELTPKVADEVTRILRSHGVSVIRVPADFDGQYGVKDAVFIHFDGTSSPCTSGASIGYHAQSARAAADSWRSLYQRYWPFLFQPDNFTDNLRDYYAFRQVHASDAALVLELGELTCPAQSAGSRIICSLKQISSPSSCFRASARAQNYRA